MRSSILLSMLFTLVVGTNPVVAADLTKVPRTIARESSYQSKPKYCLLVFGPEAKTRIWLVQDGSKLYVDRNGNGDLTEANEQVALNTQEQLFEVGDIVEAGGKIVHTGLEVKLQPTIRLTISLEGKRLQYTVGNLQFADRASEAPIVHLNGPLTLRLAHPRLELPRGQLVIPKLMADIGTPGLGPETFASISREEIPLSAEPVVEIEFANRSDASKPLTARVSLRH